MLFLHVVSFFKSVINKHPHPLLFYLYYYFIKFDTTFLRAINSRHNNLIHISGSIRGMFKFLFRLSRPTYRVNNIFLLQDYYGPRPCTTGYNNRFNSRFLTNVTKQARGPKRVPVRPQQITYTINSLIRRHQVVVHAFKRLYFRQTCSCVNTKTVGYTIKFRCFSPTVPFPNVSRIVSFKTNHSIHLQRPYNLLRRPYVTFKILLQRVNLISVRCQVVTRRKRRLMDLFLLI